MKSNIYSNQIKNELHKCVWNERKKNSNSDSIVIIHILGTGMYKIGRMLKEEYM